MKEKKVSCGQLIFQAVHKPKGLLVTITFVNISIRGKLYQSESQEGSNTGVVEEGLTRELLLKHIWKHRNSLVS